MTRWSVLAAGIVLQSILGGVYAWSSFVPPLTEEYKLTNGQCGLIFGVMIAVFSLAMIPSGRILQKYGARLTAGIGAILFSAGYLLASLSDGSFIPLLISLGVVTGTGIGFGYVCPLTAGMKWFPKHKGLVTGVSVAGFGGGAILLSSLSEYLLYSANLDVLGVFRFVGLVLGGTAFVSAMFIKEPAEAKTAEEISKTSSNVWEQLAVMKFWLICLGMFSGTFAGLLVVGNLKPMMISMGLNEGYSTFSIHLFALGNIAGRIFWGRFHDRLGSQRTIVASLSFLALSLLLLASNAPTLALPAALAIGLGFGGCFVVYAGAVVGLFGIRLFPKLYPICFLFYGLAALMGPPLGGWMADIFGSYNIGVIASIVVIGLSLSFVLFSWNEKQSAYFAEAAEE